MWKLLLLDFADAFYMALFVQKKIYLDNDQAK